MGSCCFIGHRDAPETLLPALEQAVERHIVECGVGEFLVGRYGRFDALAVMAAKKRHRWVTLTLLLPYHPFDRPVPTPEGFDGTLYPPGMESVPKRLAIVRANRWMVEHSDFLIAYVWHGAGHSRKILEAARRRQARGWMQVCNLAGPLGETRPR